MSKFIITYDLINSKSLICFDKLKNKLCFWCCIAYYYGAIRDRCNQLAKELYKEFIGNSYSINEYQVFNIKLKTYEDLKQN